MSKKNIFLICLVIVLGISFSGCGTDSIEGSFASVDAAAQENESENSSESEDTIENHGESTDLKASSVQEKNSSVSFKIVKDDRPVKDDEGRLIVNRYYEKVVLEESNEIFKNINKLIQNDCNEFFAAHDELDYQDFSTDPYISDVVADEENAYFYRSNATVTNNSNGILSIMLEQDWCMGGVRNTNYYGLNYNLNTGATLELTDIFPEEEMQIYSYIVDQTQNYIYENFDDVDEVFIWEVSQNICDHSISDFDFYVEGKNVCLCYPEDEIIPLSESVVIKCPII